MANRYLYLLTLSAISLFLAGCGSGGSSSSGPGEIQPPESCFSNLGGTTEDWSEYEDARGNIYYLPYSKSELYRYDLSSSITSQVSNPGEQNIREVFPSNTGRFVHLSHGQSTSGGRYIKDISGERSRDLRGDANELSWAPGDDSYFQTDRSNSGLGIGVNTEDPRFISTSRPLSVEWSEDGTLVATATQENIWLYSTESGDLLGEIEPLSNDGEQGQFKAASIRFSPNNRFLSYEISIAPVGQGYYEDQLYVLNLQTGESQFVSSSAVSGHIVPAWSPSSRYIAAGKWNRDHTSSLEVYSVESDSLQSISIHPHRLVSFAWSPSKDTLAYSANTSGPSNGRLYVVNIETGSTYTASQDGWIFDFGWSPDARYIAYFQVLPGEKTRIYTADTKQRCYQELDDIGSNTGTEIKWSPSSRYLLYRARNAANILEYYATQFDGSERHFLNQLIESNSEQRVLSWDWMPTSDTAVFKRRLSESEYGHADSIIALEINRLWTQTIIPPVPLSTTAPHMWLRPELP